MAKHIGAPPGLLHARQRNTSRISDILLALAAAWAVVYVLYMFLPQGRQRHPKYMYEPVLISYAYFEKDQIQRANFEYFLAVGSKYPMLHSNMHWVFVVSSDNCAPCTGLYNILNERDGTDLTPLGIKEASFNSKFSLLVRTENAGMDLGAHNITLEWMSYRGMLSNYKYFIFLNSSVKGPFLPPWVPAEWHWTTAYLAAFEPPRNALGGTAGGLPALPHLAEAVEAATQPRPCSEVALGGVLTVCFGIFSIWPGDLGVLRSRAAAPLVQPTLRLLVALLQCAVASNDASAFELIITTSFGGIVILARQLAQTDIASENQQQQQRQLQDHHCIRDLHTSMAFLTLTLTVSCMVLHSGKAATAAALATHLDGAGAAGEGQEVPADLDCYQCDRLDHSSEQCTGSLSAQPKRGHRGNASNAAAPQQQAELQMQIAQILQDLYGQSDTASTWQSLLSGSGATTRIGWDGIGALCTVLSAAAGRLQQLNAELQHAAAAVNVHGSSERHQTQLTLPRQQLLVLQAVRQLPVLLLGALCSAPAQAATRMGSIYWVHRAALSLVKQVVIGWGLQIEVQSSSAGIQVDQLPCAELLKVLLQQMNVLLQMKSGAAAALATAQSTAVGVGSSSGTSATAVDAASGIEAEAGRVRTLDIAMIEILVVLTLLQTVSQYAVWQPRVQELAAAVEHCLRSTNSGTNAAATLFVHHSLWIVCACFLWDGAETSGLHFRWPGNERQFVVKDPGPLLQAAAAAAPGSQEQQQLFTILISLLKSNSSFQQSGHAARELEIPDKAMGRITDQVARYMLDTLSSDSSSSPSALAAVPHRMSGSKLLCAAAPWLVALSRLVLHTATQLAKSLEALEDQPHATSAAGPSSSSGGSTSGHVGAQAGPGSDAAEQIKGEYLRRVLHYNECVLRSAVRLADALKKSCRLLQTSSTGGGSSSTGSDRDVTALHDDSASVTTASTVGAAAAAAGLAEVSDAVQDLQQGELQEAHHALQSEVNPAKLAQHGMLQRLFSAAGPDWQREMEAGQHLTWDVSAAAAGTPRAELDVDSFKQVSELYGLEQLLQDLGNVGQRVCAAFPLKYCCNNPMCGNVSNSSECALVSGRSRICAGCATARYCGRECQAAHWPWHKAICKAIKRQSRAKRQG